MLLKVHDHVQKDEKIDSVQEKRHKATTVTKGEYSY